MKWSMIYDALGFVGADAQAQMDADAGVMEVCVTCGREHDQKSPVCVDCWVAEQSEPEYDVDMDAYFHSFGVVDEPLHYEIA